MCGGDCPRCCFVVGIIQHFFSELTLVHICIPHTYTPCGRVMGQRSYSLSWAPTFCGRLTLPCCAFIIPHFVAFVKHFFIFFGDNGGACPSKSRVRAESNRLTQVAYRAYPSCLCALIVSQFGRFAKSYSFLR